MRIGELRQITATMKAIIGAMAVAALGLPLGPNAASAQSAETAPRQVQPATPRDQNADGNSSLSDDLSRSHGIVRPPATGDHSVIQPPSTGPHAMPVIPPPGTPGGNQDIQPK